MIPVAINFQFQKSTHQMFFLLLLPLCIASHIVLPLDYQFGTFELSIGFGLTNEPEPMVLNMEADYLWKNPINLTNDNELQLQNSSSTKLLINEYTIAQEIIGTIHIDKDKLVSINNFHFYTIYNVTNEGYNGIPLAYKFTNEKYSLIHALYNDNIIQYKSFAFAFDVNYKNEGKFYIGKVFDTQDNFTYSITFDVDDSFANWGTQLRSVIYGNDSYTYNNHSLFQIKFRYTLIPSAFFNHLRDGLFAKYIDNKQCEVSAYMLGKGILCDCNIKKEFPMFKFVFINNYVISFTFDEMFEPYQSKCSLLVRTRKFYLERFVFGLMFLRKFKSVFDYEKKAITLYSVNPFMKYSQNNIIMFIMWGVICLLVTQCGLIAYVKHKS